MGRRKTLSDAGVAALKPRAARYAAPDPELRGHYVRVTPSGSKSFVVVARNPDGKQVWATVGAVGLLNVEEARDLAREAIRRIKQGLRAIEPPPDAPLTFGDVAASWITRYAEPNGLRSLRGIERLLRLHVLPDWGDRPFLLIRRSDVAALLDDVEDGHSPRQADAVLTLVRSIMTWFATRHDDYHQPTVRGMRRQLPGASAGRERILADDEIRALWAATEVGGSYAGLVRLLLLSGQRLGKVRDLRWDDVDDGVWRIRRAPREKGAPIALRLPPLALEVVGAQPVLITNPHVFPGRGAGAINGFSKSKARIDALLPPAMPGWVLHDLRRTARSLLARAGVASPLAERILGHTAGGVERIYDRHGYVDEMGEALLRLAGLIQSIVNPPADNVVRMREAAL